jgi:kynurenine formamidase
MDSGYCTWVWREHSCAHVDQRAHVLSGKISEESGHPKAIIDRGLQLISAPAANIEI